MAGKIKLAVLIILCILMCGCSFDSSVENLLTAPKLTPEQNEIYEELKKSVGSGIKLKYPKSGDYRSAFVLYNIDDDADQEAIVFYESTNVQSGESSLRMKILDKNEGTWEAVYDLACSGSEVESISFAQLGDSERTDVLVCYSLLSQPEKVFDLLNYSGRTLKKVYSSAYSCLEVFDMNGDGMDELVAVTADKVNHTSTAEMFTDSKEGFEKLSDVSFGGNITDYLQVTKGMSGENTPAIFLDYSRGNGQSGTEVLYCFGNRLYSPQVTAGGASPVSRLTNDYMPEIYCFDIDNDGFVEIPATTPLPGYEKLTKPEQLCAVQWYTVSNGNYLPKYYSYYSGKYGFIMLFPNRWRGVVTAAADFTTNEIVFLSYNPDTGLKINEKNELMRIRAVDKDDSGAMSEARGMKILGENDDTLYCCSESNNYLSGKLALTDSELKNSFIIM